MKRFDAHVHSTADFLDPKELIEKLESAGLYGCCVFSPEPLEFRQEFGEDFETRMQTVLNATKDYPDRLFPVLWIHPKEENILERVALAAERGICAFKIICNDFYVYEEDCMNVLRRIAELNKPVFFHSGILWDSQVSSKYNKPLNWEALLDIEGLRFSLVIAPGPGPMNALRFTENFLNALTTRSSAEIFLDMTPGTPVPYRKNLLEKLMLSGYDVSHNLLFGTDCTANSYNSQWAKKWQDIDDAILDEFGVCAAVREGMYRNNLLRFLGKSTEVYTPVPPIPDDANAWSPYNDAVAGIIEKWYLALNFPKELNREFYKALETLHISDAIRIDTYDCDCTDGKRNLLSFLYMCQALEEKYLELGISREILLDTLYDIVRYTVIWTNLKGSLFLGELGWRKNHLSGSLFKLGRLQFNMGLAEHTIPAKNILKGDRVLEVHIPEEGPLSPDAVDDSFHMAARFFGKYFPDFHYDFFTCHSWLLDAGLKEFLKPDSNILQFQKRFERAQKEESYVMLRYIFRWNTNKLNLADFTPRNTFAAKIKEQVLAGKKFYEVTGVIPK